MSQQQIDSIPNKDSLVYSRDIVSVEDIKKDRGNYFVEYKPPNGTELFAGLNLVFYKDTNLSKVKNYMETEAKDWVYRYPIPVRVSAYDEKGDDIEIGSRWNEDFLYAWMLPENKIELRWGVKNDKEIPDDALSIDRLLNVFSDINYKTEQENKEQAEAKLKQRAKEVRIGVAMIFLWVVVPYPLIF